MRDLRARRKSCVPSIGRFDGLNNSYLSTNDNQAIPQKACSKGPWRRFFGGRARRRGVSVAPIRPGRADGTGNWGGPREYDLVPTERTPRVAPTAALGGLTSLLSHDSILICRDAPRPQPR